VQFKKLCADNYVTRIGPLALGIYNRIGNPHYLASTSGRCRRAARPQEEVLTIKQFLKTIKNMKYFKVTPGSNANRKVGNESYVLFKKGIKNEILLTIFNEDFPSCELKFSPLYLEEPPYTDLLEDYSMGYGLTISERAFTVIKALNLGKHKFYELANVYDGDTRIQLNFKYYRLELIKIPSHYLDTVDFGNSVWATKKFNTDIEKEVRIENYEKYKELKKEDNNLYFKKLKFIKGIFP
jgi:hypothetical protein